MNFPLSAVPLAFLFTQSLVGCASTTPGSHPHDMSAGHHEAAAASEGRAAQAHGAQYSPDASVKRERCGRGSRGSTDADGGCWTSSSNPTTEHLKEAQYHQKMAADHRAGSQALRDAESRACTGIANEDRDESPFDHGEDIAGVAPLTVDVTSGKLRSVRTEGATVTFRAFPGMTTPWLQRVVDCHLARNAALGHDVPEMANCPLVLKGVAARVYGTDAGFAVAIRSDDSATAQEILKRARALARR